MLTDDDGRGAPLTATQLGRLLCDHLVRWFRIERPWQPGTYPIACATRRGERVFVGTVTAR